MEYKLLEKQDVELMKYFVDDEKTEYDEALLNAFLGEKTLLAMLPKKITLLLVLRMGIY